MASPGHNELTAQKRVTDAELLQCTEIKYDLLLMSCKLQDQQSRNYANRQR